MAKRFLLLALLPLAFSCVPGARAADPSEDDMVRALTPQPPPPLTRGLSRGMQVRGAPEGRLELAVQFELGSARVTNESAATLSRLAAAMKSPALAERHFRIEGHTDSTGSTAGNTRLSGRRADAVRDFLAHQGVDVRRMSTIGLGSAVPADREHPESGVNRRVVILSMEQAQMVALPSSAATVQRVTGTLLVKRAGAEIALQPGARLKEGDVAMTGPGGNALVRLDDGAKLLVREGTQLELGKLQSRGDAGSWTQGFKLLEGAVRYITGALGHTRPQAVRVSTYSATIGIRGTDFDVVVLLEAERGSLAGTYVKVNRGAVTLAGLDGSRADVNLDEQGYAGPPAPATRGGKREPAATRLSRPADVFRTGALDELLDGK